MSDAQGQDDHVSPVILNAAESASKLLPSLSALDNYLCCIPSILADS
jgi:hypothetical protein